MKSDIQPELAAIIRKQIEDDMAGLKITDFRASSDVDHDGDAIIRLQVAYDEESAEPLPAQRSAVVRHVRSLLETQLPNTFPVFRFITSRELEDEAK